MVIHFRLIRQLIDIDSDRAREDSCCYLSCLSDENVNSAYN